MNKFSTTKVAMRDMLDEKIKELETSNGQRDRAVAICDAMMAWETPADARKTSKDLSQLKKEINQ
jgi:hypothetical protein